MNRQNWKEINGDETLALDWPLDENSRVWEIGGYEGRWAQQIWDKFHCNIRIFEPQLWAVDRLMKRFYGNTKIDVRPYGLWVADHVFEIGNYHTDGASMIVDDRREPMQPGAFKDIKNEIGDFSDLHGNLWPIDVALMNIEGAEWDLIPYMCIVGAIGEIRNFWCQFHEGAARDPQNQYVDIFRLMDSTHDMIWDCYPTAVAWRKR